MNNFGRRRIVLCKSNAPVRTCLWTTFIFLLAGIISCTSPTPTPPVINPTNPPQTQPQAVSPTAEMQATATAVEPENTPEPTAIPATQQPAEPAEVPAELADRAFDHTVQPGESLLGLAIDYGVPIAAIQMASQLGESTALQVDQVLTIPPASDWAGASPYWQLYIIQPGDTLYGISAEFDLPVQDLLSANDMLESDYLSVDQEFILPFSDPAYLVAQEATPTPLPTLIPTPAPTATSRVTIMEPITSTEELEIIDEEPVEEPTEPPAESDPAPEPTQAPAAAPPPSYVAGWQAELFNLINQVRANHGLAALAYNANLAVAAQNHAVDCQQRGWCSHTGSDGTTSATRIARAGYLADGTAECWVYTTSPQKAVEYWMDEVPPNDPHRRTLLSTYLAEVGIGIAPADDWGFYFIADFGHPAGS